MGTVSVLSSGLQHSDISMANITVIITCVTKTV